MKAAALILVTLIVASFVQVAAQEKEPYDWLFMVYLDGDNNLESYGVKDLNEMEQGLSVAPQANIALLVLFDGGTGRYIGHKGAKIYKVAPDTSTSIGSKVVKDMGEVNMGDPNTLTDFVDYGTSNYPAYNHALVLWNHGSGWRVVEEEREDVLKDVCFDDTSGDSLKTEEISDVMPMISSACNRLEFLGFDACLMQMAEITGEVYDNTDFIAASQETEPGDGWDYSYLIGELAGYPEMSAESLAAASVAAYSNYYGSDYDVTFSAVRSSEIPALNQALKQFSDALLNGLTSEKDAISSARNVTQEFAYADYIDLYEFAKNLDTKDQAITDAAAGVMNAVDACMVSEFHTSDLEAHGISIWFNTSKPASTLIDRYTNLNIAETNWLDFLLAYYG